MKNRFKKELHILVVAALTVICLAGCADDRNALSNPTVSPYPTAAPKAAQLFENGGIYISEVAFAKDENEFFVELSNTRNASVFLEDIAINGVGLEKLQVKANGCLALSKDNLSDSEFAAVFTDEIILTVNGKEADRLKKPENLPDGVSLGRTDEKSETLFFLTATPGRKNGGSTVKDLNTLLAGFTVRINEIMGKSRFFVIDEDGDAVDWVELKNTGKEAVNLANIGISDDFEKPFKFLIPEITLGPGECLLICLSGKEKEYNADSPYLHAPFKLGEDEGLVLTNKYGFTIDKAENIILHDNLSFGRTSDDAKWQLIPLPTPGRENGTIGFDSFEEYENGQTKTIIVSEVCAVSSDNVAGLPAEDWIELKNVSDEAVNLYGYRLSDDIRELDKFVFPDVSIAPGGYLVLNAGAQASQVPGKLNTGFKMGSSGSTVYLTDSEGYPVDIFETGAQRANVSSGQRYENNKTVREFYTSPTRGKQNSAGKSGYATNVVITSDTTNITAESHTVTLSSMLPGGKIYYTLDGSTPTVKSKLYSEPFTVTESCVVKAINVQEGLVDSAVATRTFLCDGKEHTLAILCISSDPAGLFSEASGIFATGNRPLGEYPYFNANYWRDWQRNCTFEFFENGEQRIAFDASMKMYGQYTRARESKSFSVNLKDACGPKSVYYPFFGENGVKEFSNFVIRSAGQDQSQTMIHDAFIARSVIHAMDIDVQDERPVALYINGQYMGLYFIREKINEKFIENRSGIKEDNLDAIRANDMAETGDTVRLKELISYIRTHDMSTPEALEYIEMNVDLEEWMNYWIVETYFGNVDSGNIRRYAAKDNSVRWRWVLYDMDMALEKYEWKNDLFSHILNPVGHGTEDMFYTYLTYNLLAVNPVSRDRFLKKYAEMMKNVLNPERLVPICRDYVEEIRSEMVYHCEIKKEINYAQWDRDTSNLVNKILVERHDIVKQQIQKNFKLSDEEMKALFGE